jgi:hypothetical protein
LNDFSKLRYNEESLLNYKTILHKVKELTGLHDSFHVHHDFLKRKLIKMLTIEFTIFSQTRAVLITLLSLNVEKPDEDLVDSIITLNTSLSSRHKLHNTNIKIFNENVKKISTYYENKLDADYKILDEMLNSLKLESFAYYHEHPTSLSITL